MTDAYPLQWPVLRPRTGQVYRKNGAFKKDGHDITAREATERLQREIDMIGATSPVLSSNLLRNLDGSVRGNQIEPPDPGVALYFTLDGKPVCMPCDTYSRAAQNIAAIAKHIEATRAIERYGVASLAEMFTGFEALPPPSQGRPWRDVLEMPGARDVSREIIEAAFRRLARERHPDRGGSDSMMAELNAARDQAMRELVA